MTRKAKLQAIRRQRSAELSQSIFHCMSVTSFGEQRFAI
jgi:hypothetical protein